MEAKAAVANQSLTLLGASTITSFDDGTPNARHCAQLWPLLLEEAMGAHPWRFSRSIEPLNVVAGEAADAKLYGFARAFALPPSIAHPARARFYPPNRPAGQISSYAITQTRLYADETALVIQYQDKAADPSRWSGDFRAFFVRGFAGLLAGPVGKAKTVGDAFDADAFGLPSEGRRGGLLGLALTADAQSEPDGNRFGGSLSDAGPFVEARFGAGPFWRLP